MGDLDQEGLMAMGKRGAEEAPRPRSGYAREDQRHTVRVRVPNELVEPLMKRWKCSAADAVIRAVREAGER